MMKAFCKPKIKVGAKNIFKSPSTFNLSFRIFLVFFWLLLVACKCINVYIFVQVGTEWVTKGQNIDQSYQSVAGIARSLYGRVFSFIVEKCNTTLVDDTMKKAVFIGVLDIAGFEIFEFNGFEQLCINFCNEVGRYLQLIQNIF